MDSSFICYANLSHRSRTPKSRLVHWGGGSCGSTVIGIQPKFPRLASSRSYRVYRCFGVVFCSSTSLEGNGKDFAETRSKQESLFKKRLSNVRKVVHIHCSISPFLGGGEHKRAFDYSSFFTGNVHARQVDISQEFRPGLNQV